MFEDDLAAALTAAVNAAGITTIPERADGLTRWYRIRPAGVVSVPATQSYGMAHTLLLVYGNSPVSVPVGFQVDLVRRLRLVGVIVGNGLVNGYNQTLPDLRGVEVDISTITLVDAATVA